MVGFSPLFLRLVAGTDLGGIKSFFKTMIDSIAQTLKAVLKLF